MFATATKEPAPKQSLPHARGPAFKGAATVRPLASPIDALRHDPGRPLPVPVRQEAEQALGRDFSRVRIHAEQRAGLASEALGARAFTVGSHIAFSPAAYAPGTKRGRTLLLHELAHTIQQGERPLPPPGLPVARVPRSDPSEREAREVAAGHSPHTVLRSQPLAVACDDSDDLRKFSRDIRKAVDDSLFVDAIKQIGTPQFHKDEVIRFVDHIDVDYVKRSVNLLGDRTLSDIAGSPSGHEVLEHMLARLPAGAAEHAKVESVLESRGTGPQALPVATASAADTAAIDRINKAVDADPRKSEYAKGIVPLHFPVSIYTAGRAEDGGVYYDPNLSEAGEVPAKGFKTTIATGPKTQVVTPTQYPLLFIKLGPSALGFTDTFIQATLWHEFKHYTRFNEFRAEDKGKSADTKALEEEAELNSGSPLESHESEATSTEIADYGAKMTDAELKSNLLYLGRYLSGALPDFKTQAIERISDSAAGAARLRIVKVIDSIQDKKRKKALQPLRDRLTAAAKPTAPAAPKQ